MTIYFYMRLTRNLEIGNSPVWVLLNIWRLGRVRDTKFGTDVPNEMLLNAAQCQVCGFHCFWVINGKPTKVRQGGKTTPVTQIRVKKEALTQVFWCEFCKIFKNIVFTEHERATASAISSFPGITSFFDSLFIFTNFFLTTNFTFWSEVYPSYRFFTRIAIILQMMKLLYLHCCELKNDFLTMAMFTVAQGENTLNVEVLSPTLALPS